MYGTYRDTFLLVSWCGMAVLRIIFLPKQGIPQGFPKEYLQFVNTGVNSLECMSDLLVCFLISLGTHLERTNFSLLLRLLSESK